MNLVLVETLIILVREDLKCFCATSAACPPSKRRASKDFDNNIGSPYPRFLAFPCGSDPMRPWRMSLLRRYSVDDG